MIAQADVDDQDGTISMKEFMAVMGAEESDIKQLEENNAGFFSKLPSLD